MKNDINAIYETPYGSVLINTNAKNVGIFLSGGLDSAVVLYLIAKTFTEKNIKTPIQPLTIRRKNSTEFKQFDRVDIYPYVDKIILYIKNKFPNVTILDPIKEDANFWWASIHENGRNISSYTYTMTVLSNFLKWKYLHFNSIDKTKLIPGTDFLYCEYNGVTKNPPKNSSVPQSEESHRDFFTENRIEGSATVFDYDDTFAIHYDPFRNADKRITMWLAHNLNILEDLLPITRSCEGGPDETENFTKECMQCWWCLERHWALENFNNTDL